MTPFANQHTPEWQRANRSLDLLALLTSARDRLAVIKTLSWQDVNSKQVYLEACAALAELKKVQAEEAARHARWLAQAQRLSEPHRRAAEATPWHEPYTEAGGGSNGDLA